MKNHPSFSPRYLWYDQAENTSSIDKTRYITILCITPGSIIDTGFYGLTTYIAKELKLNNILKVNNKSKKKKKNNGWTNDFFMSLALT